MDASVLLTKEVPKVDLQTNEIDIGWKHDGIFIVDSYPYLIEAGGIVEVRYDDVDCGVHEVEVIAALAEEDQEHAIALFPHVIPDYDDDFSLPTLRVDTFALSAHVAGDLDMMLRVDIDRAPHASTRICVRSSGLEGIPLTNRNDPR